jgi:hypothetical protein
MNTLDLVKTKKKEELERILSDLLEAYLNPAFGALPKREVDLMFLDALENLGGISKDPSTYELVSELRVTRNKARTLYYDRELRRLDKNTLDRKAIEALKNPILQKQGDLFVLEIENPLVSDHLRNMVQKVGYATDGSFSPSLVKLSINAFVKLLDEHLGDKEKNNVRKALVRAGAPDGSFKGIVKGVLSSLGKKVASDAGEEIAENITEYIGPLWDASSQHVYNTFAELFKHDKK